MQLVRVGVTGVLAVTALTGCPNHHVSWVSVAPPAPPRSPASVGIYFTRRAVPRPYRVVARYHVRASSSQLSRTLKRVVGKAARHGCDAIVVERAVGATQTVWSWVFLLIPITESAHVLDVVGVRFTAPGGLS
jgi:hypothetical protein